MSNPMKRALGGGLALLALGLIAGRAPAQIENLSLEQMVVRTDDAVVGAVVHRKVFRVDHPVDGPKLYYTAITVSGRSLRTGESTEITVIHPGGFIGPDDGVWNSVAPHPDEVRLGRRVVVFSRWTENMGGGVSGNALYAAKAGVFRVIEGRKGEVVLGKGAGHAIAANVRLSDLDERVTALANEAEATQ